MTEPGTLDVMQVAADVLVEFLEVAFHAILYVRNIYPAGVFCRKKKYNVPVQMCNHPAVLQYVETLLDSLRPLLATGKLEKVLAIILDSNKKPVERFVFDICPSAKKNVGADSHLLRLEQSLRAFLLKLNTCDAVLEALPDGCSWTAQIYTTESASIEMQLQQRVQDFTWIEADKEQVMLKDVHLVPLKGLDSSIVKMQLYVEESKREGKLS